ncbi:hypothetical protein AMECASPLE_038584 [Ameca splendens]|uniref:Uncharacterized protein n=1 Tax=Ameca splendens TaxID=208324 RepID=A0ABV0Y8E4_9TELE
MRIPGRKRKERSPQHHRSSTVTYNGHEVLSHIFSLCFTLNPPGVFLRRSSIFACGSMEGVVTLQGKISNIQLQLSLLQNVDLPLGKALNPQLRQASGISV